MIPTIRAWLAWSIFFTALYLLLVDTTVLPEVVAGALTAAFASAIMVRAGREERVTLTPDFPRSLALLCRLPSRVVVDSGLVFVALWRRVVRREQIEGEFCVVPFHAGDDDPRARARRALVVIGLSLPPNSYVVSVDAAAGHLIVHQLVRRATPPGGGDRDWPQ